MASVALYAPDIAWCISATSPMSSKTLPSLVEYFFLSPFLRFLLDFERWVTRVLREAGLEPDA